MPEAERTQGQPATQRIAQVLRPSSSRTLVANVRTRRCPYGHSRTSRESWRTGLSRPGDETRSCGRHRVTSCAMPSTVSNRPFCPSSAPAAWCRIERCFRSRPSMGTVRTKSQSEPIIRLSSGRRLKTCFLRNPARNSRGVIPNCLLKTLVKTAACENPLANATSRIASSP